MLSVSESRFPEAPRQHSVGYSDLLQDTDFGEANQEN
jgi:hypothetical protein